MTYRSHLPISLLASVIAGVVCVMICLTLGGGFWLAALSYSVGGAMTLVATAAFLAARTTEPKETLQPA